MHKKTIVVHSGGMDSSICLQLAIQEFGAPHVLSLSFNYGQRHSPELEQAQKICQDWSVDHLVLSIPCLQEITSDALVNHELPIVQDEKGIPNTLVVGRNGLMARLAAIHAHHLGAHCIYMGVIEVEGSNSGYRDCSRQYMDLTQDLLRLDLDDPSFEIRTPVVFMTKCQTLELAYQLQVLDYLLEHTITCYRGVSRVGCCQCPACFLRNLGLQEFCSKYPYYQPPYPINIYDKQLATCRVAQLNQ